MATFEMRVSCSLNPIEVARNVGGEWTIQPPSPLTGVSLDSRVVRPGDLFVALRGEQCDGHQFIEAAARNGASGAVLSTLPDDVDSRFPCLCVPDTLAALHALARGRREAFSGRVVALTGSVGKTTVKEMTASILQRAGSTVSTLGNFNNVTGVPLSILQANPEVEYAVIEVGMSMPGEILSLMPMVKPHVVAVLNIAPVHMENFQSLEAIAAAKAEIFTHLEPEAVAVVGADDPLVRRMDPGPGVRKLFFGTGPEADVRVGKPYVATLDGQRFDLFWRRHKLTIHLAALGDHNRVNAAAAAALGLAAGVGHRAVAEGLAAYRPGMMRSHVVRLSDGSVLFEDCYNASPVAFQEAVKTLVTIPKAGRRVVVMGDMLELGSGSVRFHRAAGEQAAELGVDLFFGFGPQTRHAVLAFKERAPTRLCGHFSKLGDLLEVVVGNHETDDVILVNGSRGMRLERLTEQLNQQL